MSPEVSSHMAQPHPWKMLSKASENGLVYTHKFNESDFFDVSNLHILHVIFSTKNGESWQRKETLSNETRRIFTTFA